MNKRVFIAGLLFMTSVAFGQSKVEVESMLDQMAKSGMISPQQIEKARLKLQKMDDKDFGKLIEAGKAMRNDPAIKRKIKKMKLNKK